MVPMPDTRKDRHEERARRARRDLERTREQSEKLFGVQAAPEDGEAEDAAALWGRRIGRALGYIAAAVLILYLISMISLP